MTTKQLMTMVVNNRTDGNDGVPVWLPEEKRVTVAAERAGLVRVERTEVKVGGYQEWRVWLAWGVRQ